MASIPTTKCHAVCVTFQAVYIYTATNLITTYHTLGVHTLPTHIRSPRVSVSPQIHQEEGRGLCMYTHGTHAVTRCVNKLRFGTESKMAQ